MRTYWAAGTRRFVSIRPPRQEETQQVNPRAGDLIIADERTATPRSGQKVCSVFRCPRPCTPHDVGRDCAGGPSENLLSLRGIGHRNRLTHTWSGTESPLFRRDRLRWL